MNSNGGVPTLVTEGYEPSFSPDGNRIAFTSAENGFGVFVINSDGTNRIRLTGNSSLNFDPAFSPDGNQIAFESIRDGNFQIYQMNSDGSNQTRLTNNAAGDFSPSWGGLVLAAPTNLTATAVSPTQINLAWTDNSAGEDGFLIERCEGGGKCLIFIQIAGTSANATAFSNTGVKPFTFYTYRVRAFGTGGSSSYSNTAKAKTPKP
jgi:WD40 repeat protein